MFKSVPKKLQPYLLHRVRVKDTAKRKRRPLPTNNYVFVIQLRQLPVNGSLMIKACLFTRTVLTYLQKGSNEDNSGQAHKKTT